MIEILPSYKVLSKYMRQLSLTRLDVSDSRHHHTKELISICISSKIFFYAWGQRYESLIVTLKALLFEGYVIFYF